ncbi:MAG: hypothetical protein ABIR19_08445 [Ginsengibacter sp.]
MTDQIKQKGKLSDLQIIAISFITTLVCGYIFDLIWTEHNTHDPGITLLEGLDYSLTENDPFIKDRE